MRHIKTINELNKKNYDNASKSLRDLGHPERADRIEAHSVYIELKEAREKYDIGVCTFEGGHKGEFLYFDEYMSFDIYMDGNHVNHGDDGVEQIYFPLFFRFEGKTNYDNTSNYSPFSVNYNVENKEVMVDIGLTEEMMEEDFGQRKLILNNRQDALRVLKSLRKLDFTDSFKSNDGFEQWHKRFKEMVNGSIEEEVKGIYINQLWK